MQYNHLINAFSKVHMMLHDHQRKKIEFQANKRASNHSRTSFHPPRALLHHCASSQPSEHQFSSPNAFPVSLMHLYYTSPTLLDIHCVFEFEGQSKKTTGHFSSNNFSTLLNKEVKHSSSLSCNDFLQKVMKSLS